MREIKFADNLKRLRINSNLSQKTLAEKLNVNYRTISAWEKSICEPSIEMLVKISEIFNETLEDIIF
ncbi:MAG: helix-turn-helix transcriptional regulator [Clostridiales bacterium]|nr:helix-turn-helix transcriptional regulator [Clostridiales bacterium]